MSDIPFDPGLLRHRVRLERALETSDGAGGASVTWQEVATVWARIEPTAASEQPVAGHSATVATHRVTIRWRQDVTGGMRVVFRGRELLVLAASDPDEGRRYLVLLAREERP